jgi:uncharacterized protein
MQYVKQDRTQIEPNLFEYVYNHIKNLDGDVVIMVGADSLPPNRFSATIVGVVAIYLVGHGAHIIFTKRKFPAAQTKNIASRLWKEVELAVDIAQELRVDELQKLLPNLSSLEVNVQLDFNEDTKYPSGRLKDSAIGYVKALGYDCEIKPFAFAATYAADKICRGQF